MKDKEFMPRLSSKLGITALNRIQERMLEVTPGSRDVILLSPTGSGKTVAFVLPLLRLLKSPRNRIQAVIIAPSRELVLQITGVISSLANGYKTVALFGGHNVVDEVNSLKITPDIVVATPGRLLDQINRGNLLVKDVSILVLDEFDKSLEQGFEEEMGKIIKKMSQLTKIILTSATKSDSFPEFLKLNNPITLDYLSNKEELDNRINIRRVDVKEKDKLQELLNLLHFINKEGPVEKTIIFLNHRESAERVYNFLKKQGVDCVLYHGALVQRERESAIALFNNGSRPVLVATDLAARGLDIEGVNSIIHYHLPLTEENYIHRNGRTARVNREGDVYLMVGPDEKLADYINPDSAVAVDNQKDGKLVSGYETLYVSGGKKEKVSRGDILGFFIKEGGLQSEDIGKINIFDHYSLVAVKKERIMDLLSNIENKKLKGEKRKISIYK